MATPPIPPLDPEPASPEARRGVALAGPSPRRLFGIAVFAAVLGFIVTLSFGYADHDPRPHGVRIAVAGPTMVRSQVAAALQRGSAGGFVVVAAPDARAATRDVRSQSTAGAEIVPATGPVTIVTAGAAGALQQQVVTAALTGSARAMGRTVTALDVAPLPEGDRSGLSSFVFGLGLLIPSVIGSVGLFLVGMRLRLWWRVAAAAVFAFLAACGGVLALDTILGALTGSGLELIAIGFAGALSFVLFVAALQALVGLPGTGLAAIGFIFVGNAVSGGSVPVSFLPDGFRQIAPWLPNSAIVRGARDVVYFDGHDLGHTVLVLTLWPLVALAVLVAIDLLHLSERRRRPEEAVDIYRTPAIAHVRRRMAGRAAASDTTGPAR